MLAPDQFSPNDVWIVFQLNDAPISTVEDGDFNVLCLMDAASCYILGNEFVPLEGSTAPREAVARLIETSQVQAGCIAQKFFLSSELETKQIETLLDSLGVEYAAMSENELSVFISEAKEGFLAHVGGGKIQ